MIFTCTVNPAIDYTILLSDKLELGKINQADENVFLAGGKGLNVSMMLSKLEINSEALCFLGGYTGKFIFDFISKYPKLKCRSVSIKEENRINIKIRSNVETDINFRGPQISDREKIEFYKLLDNVNENDWFIISGSFPKGIDIKFIKEISKIIKNKKARLVMDTTDLTLSDYMEISPFLIKPNLSELDMILPNEHIDVDNLSGSIKKLKSFGIQNVLLSLGSNGAQLYYNDSVYYVHQPKLKEVNTVGAGDTMLATFIGKLSLGLDIEEALKYSAAAGAASVYTMGLPSIEEINRNYEKIIIRKEEFK